MSVRRLLLVTAFAACSIPAFAEEPGKSMVEPQPGGSAESQKVICKKVAETGSLVKRTKVCLTRDQWNRSAENHRRYGEQLQDELRGRPGGN